jgi:polyisoprenoid-binding protein YceI
MSFDPRICAAGLLLAAFTGLHSTDIASRETQRGPEWPARDAVLQSGTLSFVGHSTVGAFVGTTSVVSGAVVGSTEITTARGWVEAPVATLATGNTRRDRDLRATMEIEKYPTVRFDLAGVALGSPAQAATIHGVLHGTLAIHGAAHDVAIPATLVSVGDTVHVSGTFPLDLGDYGIGGLTRLFGTLRMHPNIEVSLDLRFVATTHTPRGQPTP